MTVGLCDVDGHGYPNLALMRLASYHRSRGDRVEWFVPLCSYDRVYASKVFTFTPDNPYLPADAIKGGTGYDVHTRLPAEVEACQPDYTIYPQHTAAFGFLSRGCPNKCPWCVVSAKEGAITPVADIEQVAQGRRQVVLMDNNFLATPRDFVERQLTRAAELGLRLDFNQALDARRIDFDVAQLLARCRWKPYIRMACDTDEALPAVKAAIYLLRSAGYRKDVQVYVLAKNDGLRSAYERVMALQAIDDHVQPFVMPYRSLTDNSVLPSHDIKALARWCNLVSVRRSCAFSEYRYLSIDGRSICGNPRR